MEHGFERVIEKLNEARFFLRALGRTWDDSKANYYFSAFASAARSVTFTLQASCSRIPGFRAWYAAEQDGLRGDALARFLLQARNETQKIGVVPLRYRGQALHRTHADRHYCRRVYRFVALEQGADTPPDGDAAALSRRHLINLGRLVLECFVTFREALGPSAEDARRVQRATTVGPLMAPRCPLDRMIARAGRGRASARRIIAAR